MSRLLVTWDAEVFGDGSGDIERVVIEPTISFVRAATDEGFQGIVFLEVGHVWHLEHREGGREVEKFARLVESIEEQGFEVHPHVHTQWSDVTPAGMPCGPWVVEDTERAVQEWFGEALAWGLAWIQEIVGARGSNRVWGFRAGNLNWRPWMLGVLDNLGIRCDSSVFPGGRSRTRFARYDYSWLQSRSPFIWCGRNWVEGHSLEGILEVPLAARRMRGWTRLAEREWLKRFLVREKRRVVVQQGFRGKSVWEVLRHLLGKHARLWDFCRLPPTTQRAWAMAEAGSGGTPDVITVIGHSKDHPGGNRLREVFDVWREAGLTTDGASLGNLWSRVWGTAVDKA